MQMTKLWTCPTFYKCLMVHFVCMLGVSQSSIIGTYKNVLKVICGTPYNGLIHRLIFSILLTTTYHMTYQSILWISSLV